MRPLIYPVALLGALVGCNTDPSDGDFPHPTLLEVVSRYFEGAPACSEPDAGSSGYARYVATLMELQSHPDGDVSATPLAVAPPTRCGQDVLFAGTNDRPLMTQDDYRYYVRIELFAADDVEVRGRSALADGELPRVVRDGEPVSPTHLGVCGSLDLPLLGVRAEAPWFALVGSESADASADAAAGDAGQVRVSDAGSFADASSAIASDAGPLGDAGALPSDAGRLTDAAGATSESDAAAAPVDAGAAQPELESELPDTRPDRAWQWSVRAQERRTVTFGQCTFERVR